MPTSTASSATRKPAEPTPEHEAHGTVLHLPHVPVPHVGMPTGTPGRLLWWGGLAGVAALGVVDWPVAVLIGAGSWVAEQYAKQSRRPEREEEPATER